MALDSVFDSAMSLRSASILGAADAVPFDPTETDTPALGAAPLGALVGTVEQTAGAADAGGSASDPGAGLTSLANAAVLQFHADIEALADQNGLRGPIHALTNLGETIGLGHIGGDNILTDASQLPAALAGGDTSGVGALLPTALADTPAAEALGTGVLHALGLKAGPLHALEAAAATLPATSPTPLEALANAAVLDLHGAIEAAGDQSGLVGTTHGITGLGETIGLGKIGDANLLTDALDTPSSLLAGDTGPLMHLPADLAATAGAVEALVSGIAADVTDGAFLSDPVGHVVAAVPALAALPIDSLANQAIDVVHATAEGLADPIAPGTIHGVVGLGNAVGLGELGGSNLATDLTQAPTALLGGDTTPLTHLPGDVAAVGTAAAGALAGIGADIGSSALLGDLGDPTTGHGVLGGTLPGAGVVGTITGAVDGAANSAGAEAGLGAVTQAATQAVGAVTGASGPVDGLAHVPGDVVAGAGTGAAPLPGAIGASVASLASAVGAAAGEVSHLGDAAPGLLHAVTTTLAPVTGGGGAGGLAGTATGLLGGTSGSGAHDLVTVTVGPQTPVSGLGIDVLSTNASGQTHLVDTHIGTAAAPTPTVASIGLLSDGSFHFPSVPGGGSDALSGVLGGAGASAVPTAGGAGVHTGVDLGAAHVDLPIAAAHADPLGALGHPIAHV